MTKQEFLSKLRQGLSGLPQADVEERVSFYNEMIEDRMEEGISEEAAVEEIGDIDVIISGIVSDIPFTKLVKEKITPKKRLSFLESTLLVLGSPIWLSLVIAAVAVIFSVYVAWWSVIISLWSVFGSLVGCAFGGIVAGIISVCLGNTTTGIILFAAGLICAGLSVFMFYGCKALSKGTVILTKKIAIGIKNRFIKKGEA